MASLAKFSILKFGSVEASREGVLVLSKITKFVSNGSGTKIFYNVYEDNSVVQVDVAESYASVSTTYLNKTVDVGIPVYIISEGGLLVNRPGVIDTANIYRIFPDGTGAIIQYYDQNNISKYAKVIEDLDILVAASAQPNIEVLSVNGVAPDNTGNIYLGGENYFPVMATGTPVNNALNLLSVYNQAVLSTPNGTALATNNRAVIVLNPGIYDLGIAALNLDDEFIDIVGLTGNPSDVVITSANAAANGTILKTSDDNVISGITVELTSAVDNDRAAIYTPDAIGHPAEVWRNVILKGTGNPTNVKGVFAGNYENVASAGPLFGSLSASDCQGVFIKCVGGNDSFASAGDISATAKLYFNIAGADSFATDGGTINAGAFLQYNVIAGSRAINQPV